MSEDNTHSEEPHPQEQKLAESVPFAVPSGQQPKSTKPHNIQVIVNANGQQHIIEFSEKLHNFNLTNSIFNFNDETQYNLNPRFSQPRHLETLREFLQSHHYDPSSIHIQRQIISDKMRQNVDPITYEVLGKYELDHNFDEAVMLLDLGEYIGINEFKEAMYVAVGCGFYIKDTDEAIDEYRTKHGLSDLSVEQEDEIIKQYAGVFDRIQKELTASVSKELEAYTQENINP